MVRPLTHTAHSKLVLKFLDKCMLSNKIMDYYIVSQGKTSIPGVDDGEEMTLTDVRSLTNVDRSSSLHLEIYFSDPIYLDHLPLLEN